MRSGGVNPDVIGDMLDKATGTGGWAALAAAVAATGVNHVAVTSHTPHWAGEHGQQTVSATEFGRGAEVQQAAAVGASQAMAAVVESPAL